MKKKKTNDNNTFEEAYEVSLDYQKPDGYWVCSYKELVLVPVKHSVREKCNHEKAAEIAQRLYPKCKINGVTYI